MKGFLLLLFISLGLNLKAQQLPDDVKQTIEKYLETIETGGDYSQILEDLSAFVNRPVKINSAGIDELLNFPLISPVEAAAIISHRNKYGAFVIINELQVLGFSTEKIKAIQPFISFELNSAEKWKMLRKDLTRGGSEFIFTGRYSPQNRNPEFEGDPVSASVRAKYHLPGKFSIGFTADKDPGEKWWNKGPDFISFHASIQNTGIIKTLCLGDFLMSAGQGLVLGSGIGIGKSAAVLNIKRSQPMLKPYRGINEFLFHRGAASTLSFGKIEWTIAASLKSIDARLTDTAMSQELAFSSVDLDGFHRSAQELAGKGTAQRHMAGSWININGKRGNTGFGWTNMGTSVPPAADNRLYRLFYPAEKQQNFLHAWQGHTLGPVHLFSEAAYLQENRKHAVSAGALISLGKGVEMAMHYRNYAPGFISPYSTAFGNSSNNENGFYSGIKIQFNRKWALSQYTDFYSQPWLTYRLYSPGRNREYLCQLDFNPTRKSQIYLRYRNIHRAINQVIVQMKTNGEYQLQSMRLHFMAPLNIHDRIEFRAEQSMLRNNGSEHSSLFYGEYTGQIPRAGISLIARYTMFSISGYYNRIYAFENQLLYDFGTVAFYGKGRSAYLLLQKKWSKKLKTGLRYAINQSRGEDAIPAITQRIFVQLVWHPD